MSEVLKTQSENPLLPLSEQDQHYLAQFEQKLQMVRDRTVAVVEGYNTGFFLHGPGGVGKSFTVLNELDRREANYKVYNSRMTGLGLYNELAKFPDAVHVLEDMEQITRDRNAQGVLRSALWGQCRQSQKGPMERQITWTTHGKDRNFTFTGGIILTSNRPLGDLPELNAVKTRIPVMHLQASDMEVRAMMRKVARKGFEHQGKQLPAEECMEVCDHVIQQSLSLHRPLDMRLLVNSFQDYLQWQEGDAGCHWKDLVTARLRERPTTFNSGVSLASRSERKHADQEVAREIRSLTSDRKERLRIWQERTGKREAALYRRLAEIQASESSPSQVLTCEN